MDLAPIKTGIYQWVSAVHPNPVTVIWDEPEGPRPADPSVRLSFISPPSRIGMDELRPADAEDGFRIVGPREMLLSVTAHGENSDSLVSDLEDSVSDPTKMEILKVSGISILYNSKARDVTVAIETKYDKRTQMDFTLLATKDTEIQVGEIREVSITTNVGGIPGSVTANSGGD